MPDLALRSILAATDLSPSCDPVLHAAGVLAQATGAALHVIHALDLPLAPYVDADEPAPFPAVVQAARDALDAQLARALPPAAQVQTARLELYAPHRAVPAYARTVAADLVVLGPHTHAGVGAQVLGSTADRLIRTLDAPCLIVRGNFGLPLRRVLVPLDLSRAARPALELALRWSHALGYRGAGPGRRTDVVVLHVVPRPAGVHDLPFERAEVEPGLNAELEAVLGPAGAPPTLAVREEVLWGGRPADEIVEFAEREWMDLVVIATHGHGALARALIGSTASSVARRAYCPVLLVPPRLWHDPPDDDAREGVREDDARPLVAWA
ncbi:MAG TPA: universal stress protein [Longimicrobiaceae bacterium]|nr:universal stress protein [Longimicrobiaceae bacterium]